MNSLRGRVYDGKSSWIVLSQLSKWLRNNSSSTSKITIPNRIERSPTDILKALESTITRDPTAMPYKFADDPYLLPYSNYTKRTYVLSMESGKKAALWIREQHSEWFQHQEADPPIEAFIPKPVYTEKSQVSEELLLNTIKQAQIDEAMHIYKLLEEDVSDEAKLSLFEMLCYYNNEEPASDEFLEEKWLNNPLNERRSWRNDPEINKLFAHLSEGEPKIASVAYNTMISAYAKYLKVEEAHDLVTKCEDKGYLLNLNSYNELISLIAQQSGDMRARWEMIQNNLLKMKTNKIRPNIRTLNACLEVITSSFTGQTPNMIQNLISEFQQLNIKPCLASYHYIIQTLRKKDQLCHLVLREIIDELEKCDEIQIQDTKDTYFFSTAMSIARQTFDLNVAERLHNLLLKENNYKFIGNAFKENTYYRNYIILLLSTKPLPEFAKIYVKLVPNIYIPETKVIMEILQTMTNNPPENVVDMIPMIWSHIVIFDYATKSDIITLFFDIVRNLNSDDERLKNEQATIAWKYFELLKEHLDRRKKALFIEANVLGNMLVLLARQNMFDEICQIFEFIYKNATIINGIISEQTLRLVLNISISQENVPAALNALEHAVKCEYEELRNLGNQIKTLPMTSKEEKLLITLMGPKPAEESAENKVTEDQ